MLFVSVACLAAFVWFGVTVELGDRTLFGHLRNIGASKESQELWRGAKAKATDAIGIEKAREALRAGANKIENRVAAEKGDKTEKADKDDKLVAPQEHLGSDDREAMRKLIGSHAQNTRTSASPR
jgi:hypothetical protein